MSLTLPLGYHLHPSAQYERNIGILYKYTDTYYKLVAMRLCRKPGYVESDDIYKNNLGEWKVRQRLKCGSQPSTKKTPQSISRTRSRVFELVMCNPFEFFGTLTIDKTKSDRYNLDEYYKKFSTWLNHYNTRNGTSIKALFVPEQHKDGAWHLHCMVLGLPREHLEQFTLDWRHPTTGNPVTAKMRRQLRNGATLYNWPAYAEKFGFVSLDSVRDKERCASYISKYITKQVENTDIGVNDHLYYCSKGLIRKQLLEKCQLRRDFTPDFENRYVKLKTYDNLNEAIYALTDGNELTTENDIVWKQFEEYRARFDNAPHDDDPFGAGHGAHDEDWYEPPPMQFHEVYGVTFPEIDKPVIVPVQLKFA
ncbi:hypothetical protein FACS18949_17150 [Clostridia bacterium]|nr:hypothetical protein FACS18949_17150 [Clostridia bacterium]